ncbi:MAG: Hsp20/alpha crystallin family protein [Promethearchaeota archaeon]|nr:MAG: Hsp20/alpha crystallin family protein [Candidatus Lokiarchaeota archaeon]
MPDDFDDFIDDIKKYFNINSDMFDVDFLFIPESERDSGLKPQNKKVKGFKISYHFESGMEKPEIRIEGNIDDQKIREYLANVDLSKYPTLKRLFDTETLEPIDANKLSLDLSEQVDNLSILEPYTEINDYKDYTEIILDIPGMSEKNIKIDISEGGTQLIFNAENKSRRFMKNIYLPFKTNAESYDLEVKNGIGIIIVKKSNR